MSNKSKEVVIVSATRTPIGTYKGSLKNMKSHHLGSIVIKEVLKRSEFDKDEIDEVIMGCVLSAGLGQAPSRQAALSAGLDLNTACTSVNKVCGSGMSAVTIACNALRSEQSEIIIAGGMENMSRAPHLLPLAREGYRFGDRQLVDHMQIDGLQDAFKSLSMGQFAEDCAAQYKFSRKDQDAFALESLKRAKRAIEQGLFKAEIVPVSVANKNIQVSVENDQQPLSANPEKIPKLRPETPQTKLNIPSFHFLDILL